MSNLIERVVVDSECIDDATYATQLNRLVLTYKNGGVYEYNKVPAFYWHGLFNARSKGKFINNHIIGQWEYKKVG